MFHISAHLQKQYDGWLEYRSDEGAMVVVRSVATRSQHACVNLFHTMQCGCDRCALDSH